MDEVDELAQILRGDPEGSEIARILLDLLTGASDETRLLVLVKLREAIRERRLTLHSPQAATDAERVVKQIVLDSGTMVTADDIVKAAPPYPRSLHHRSGASAVLNSLVNKGEIGKLTVGRETYFSSVREIVQQAQIAWMREHPGQGPEQVSPTAIAAMTGLSSAHVIRTLSELLGD